MHVTIVMYHYVREIQNSAYPKIRGLEIAGFRRQLDYLEKNFNIVRMEDVISAGLAGLPLPDKACLLTFDDGYKDHISFVFPELLKRGMQGSFFPPVKPITERVMLDVNSIHFILASSKDDIKLCEELDACCKEKGVSEKDLYDLRQKYAVPNRFDNKEVIYIKRLLQHALPLKIRAEVTAELFEKYVGKSQKAFAAELYLSIDDVREMIDKGMFFGSHGYSHLWLDRETKSSQEKEVDLSIQFLDKVGAPTKNWVMCYPYGGYSSETLEILRTKNCALGLTTKVAVARLQQDPLLELPRLDTNDLPQ